MCLGYQEPKYAFVMVCDSTVFFEVFCYTVPVLLEIYYAYC